MNPQDQGRKYENCLEKGEIKIPFSGAGIRKEDTKTDTYLIQKKLTTKASYSIKYDDLQKLTREAFLSSRLPRFDLAFNVNGKLHEYVLLRKEDLGVVNVEAVS